MFCVCEVEPNGLDDEVAPKAEDPKAEVEAGLLPRDPKADVPKAVEEPAGFAGAVLD